MAGARREQRPCTSSIPLREHARKRTRRQKGPGCRAETLCSCGGQRSCQGMHNLAVLYAEGVDGKPDYTNAVLWFRKAADYGVADSQFNLAVLVARGLGTEKNIAESYKWFALAAAQG